MVKNKNNRSRDRTILKVENSIGLSLCVLNEKNLRKYQRAGPKK